MTGWRKFLGIFSALIIGFGTTMPSYAGITDSAILEVSPPTTVKGKEMTTIYGGGIRWRIKARSKEWQERLEYKDGRVIVKQERNKEKKTNLSQGEFIYIFMSSSVPISVWKTYAKNIEDFGLTDKSSLVLRGCIGGCRYIKPTLEFISKVLEIDRDRQGIKAEVWIDPLLFRRFNIQRVPCVVYVRGQELMDNTLSAGLEENIKTKGQYFISCGDWSLKYHLEELCKKSGNQNLCRIGES